MNLRLIFSLIVLVYFSSSFTTSDVNKKKGIIFFKGTWKEALAQAKKENKPIFLDIYATWCGPCKQLKRTTFKDREVGTYFNSNFINVSIDGESDEGRLLAQKYQVNAYPTLLIIDQNGYQKTKSVGFLKPYILINFGRRIVP